MRKQIYLHIGTHKTGTTSIQNFLFENSSRLKQQGFDYLVENCVWKAHQPLGWAFQGNNAALDSYCPWKNAGIINELEKEILTSNAHSFILSSENLYHLKNKNFIERFFNRLENYDLRVIVYLRTQQKFLESWYYELVRADYCKLALGFEDFIKEPKYNLNYDEALLSWEQFVPRKNIIVMPYDKISKNNKLLQSFRQAIGIGENSNFIVTKNRNSRMTYSQLLELRELNSKNLDHQSWVKSRARILKTKMLDDNKSLMDAKTFAMIKAKYAYSNNLIKKRYGIELE